MSGRKTIVHANDWITTDISVCAESTFGLTFGEIRQFVTAGAELAVPDKETVYLEELCKSAVYVDQWSAARIAVRAQRKVAAEPQEVDAPATVTLTEAEQDAVAEQVYEAYRLGRMAAAAEHLPMWHEPESRERLPQVEIRRALDAVEAIVAARTGGGDRG